MEKRNWKRSVTLKQRMVLCLAAFFAAFALQLALNGYQARAVQQVQDDQMGNFNAISRFQGGVESSISILEAYRWENGETEEMLEKLQAACSTSNAWLWRIRFNMDGLQNVSDEQWVLYGAVETTYGSYSALLEELESCLSSGQDAKASQLYYNKVSVCGGYLSQYTMQLLKASILDAQTTYTEISELGERIALMQIVVVALCVALGCASGLMVMRLLTPVSQMIVASRAISRSQFDTPDIPLPKQPEIGQLAESFNRMKHSMAQQVSTLQEKNEIERELCSLHRAGVHGNFEVLQRPPFRQACRGGGAQPCGGQARRHDAGPGERHRHPVQLPHPESAGSVQAGGHRGGGHGQNGRCGRGLPAGRSDRRGRGHPCERGRQALR